MQILGERILQESEEEESVVVNTGSEEVETNVVEITGEESEDISLVDGEVVEVIPVHV